MKKQINIRMNILTLISKPLLTIVLILGIGTFGYMYLEDYTLLEGAYMTVITLSTVGFGLVRDISPEGMLFTIFLIIVGMSVVVYAFGKVTYYVLEGGLSKYLKGEKMKKKIEKLKEHYVICGCGRTGEKIIKDFHEKKINFVVIEKNMDTIENLKVLYGESIHTIHGDATRDEILELAKVEKASTLIAVLATDADNLFLTLSAKELNKKIRIIARAVDVNNERKLKRAGVDSVISPLDIAAQRIVMTALRPGVLSFVEVMKGKSGIQNLRFEFIEIEEKSSLVDLTLREARIPNKTNLIVIGIENEMNDNIKINPPPEEVLCSNTKLLVLGKNEQIEKLREIAKALV